MHGKEIIEMTYEFYLFFATNCCQNLEVTLRMPSNYQSRQHIYLNYSEVHYLYGLKALLLQRSTFTARLFVLKCELRLKATKR